MKLGAMVYSLLLFGLVIYLWENETFAIPDYSNGRSAAHREALWNSVHNIVQNVLVNFKSLLLHQMLNICKPNAMRMYFPSKRKEGVLW